MFKEMGTKEKKNSKINKNSVIAVLFVIAPIIMSFILLGIKWIGEGYVSFPGMKWNDEAAYIKLIQTYSKFLSPKGYWGFDGNHAIVGTGSAWSFAILAPYAIIGRIFKAGPSFVYFCNMFFIALANIILLLCVKPSFLTKIKLILAELTSTVFILYLNTDMSEIFRFSLAVVLVALLYKVYFDECPKWFKYAVVPVFILYTVQVYTFFAFCIPVYMFAITKKSKTWKRLLWSFVAMGVVAGGSYFLLHLISSNYNIAKTERLLAAVKSGNVLGAARSFAGMIKDGIIGLYNLVYTVYSNGIYVFHLMFALLLVVTGLRQFFSKKAETKDRTIGLIAAYSIVVFFFMYMTLYTIVPDTFMRGTEIAVLFSLVFMALSSDKWVVWSLILCNATGLLFLPVNLKNFQGEERFLTKEERNEWALLEEEFDSVFTLDKKADPWSNTIIMYTMEPRAIAAVPAGFGVNFALGMEYVPSDAGYLVFTTHKDRRPDWIETDYEEILEKNGGELQSSYVEIYRNDEYVVYGRRN